MLNPLFHAPLRLRICVRLEGVQYEEFSTLQAALGLPAYTLSRQLTALRDAGVVSFLSHTANHRNRIRVSMTSEGRKAWRGYLADLEQELSPTSARSGTTGNPDSSRPDGDGQR